MGCSSSSKVLTNNKQSYSKRIPKRLPENERLLAWTNKAGISWKLKKRSNDEYVCLDCPYPDTYFKIMKDDSKTVGFSFLNEEYIKLNSKNDDLIGEYERRPVENDWHYGRIVMTDSNLDPNLLSKNYLQSTSALECYRKFGLELEVLQSQHILALDVFLKSENFLKNSKYEEGYDLIENYFSHYRPGKDLIYSEWLQEKAPIVPNFGSPIAYSSMLMMREIFNYYVNIKPSTISKEKIPYLWTTVLIEESHGYYPQNLETIGVDYGEEVFHKLNPLLLKDNYKIIKDSFFLFSEYLHAITEGRFKVEMNFINIKESSVKCSLSSAIIPSAFNTKMYFSGLSPGWENENMFPYLSEDIKNNTDVYWIFYPDHRPIKNDKLNKIQYTTGGCYVTKKPMLVCDDNYLLNHFGNDKGDYHLYTDEERRAYIPQWLMHEFYHYLFNAVYKEYKLEDRGHDWFDRKLWPEDFEGSTEPDYYYEALNKRFKTYQIPIWDKLKWQVDLSGIDLNLLCGKYEYNPVENDWHIVTISRDELGTYWWTNKANVKWKLILEIKKGRFKTENDCPYYNNIKSVEINPIFSNKIVIGIESIDFGGIYHKK